MKNLKFEKVSIVVEESGYLMLSLTTIDESMSFELSPGEVDILIADLINKRRLGVKKMKEKRATKDLKREQMR